MARKGGNQDGDWWVKSHSSRTLSQLWLMVLINRLLFPCGAAGSCHLICRDKLDVNDREVVICTLVPDTTLRFMCSQFVPVSGAPVMVLLKQVHSEHRISDQPGSDPFKYILSRAHIC